MKVRLLPTQLASRRNALSLSGMVFATLLSFAAPACKKPSAVSAEKAKANVVNLIQATHSDVAEVRSGLPLGAPFLQTLFTTGKPA